MAGPFLAVAIATAGVYRFESIRPIGRTPLLAPWARQGG
jgi:hypothetical protein